MSYYNSQIAKLIEELSRLPGAGAKLAQHLTFHIINMPKKQVEELAGTMARARSNVRYCKECFTLVDKEFYPICSNDKRNHKIIIAVKNIKDLVAYKKTSKYEGAYRTSHGAAPPVLGIGPNNIKLEELIRCPQPEVEEIIIITNSSLEGEITAIYISKLIKPTGIKATRVASSASVGGDLGYVDKVTLLRILEGRTGI